MKIDANDARLTAYALGELEQDEAARMADLIRDDPEALIAVASIHDVARLLTEALALETAPALSEVQRDAVISPAQRPAAPRSRIRDAIARRFGHNTGSRAMDSPESPRESPRVRPWWARRQIALPTAALAVVAMAILVVGNINVISLIYWLDMVKTSQGHASAQKESVPEGRITVADIVLGRADERARGYGIGSLQRESASQNRGLVAQGALPAPASGMPPGFAATAEPALQSPPFGAVAPGAPGAPSGQYATPADAAAAGLAGEEAYQTPNSYWPNGYPPSNTESYALVVDNPFRAVKDEPLSTFSIDVDTASYANVRRFLSQGSLPPADAVRIEELVNYFEYDYAPPGVESDDPFAVHAAVASAPWAPSHRLVRIGLKGRELEETGRGAANLVFLVDVSGSMDEANKLPLVQSALRMLAENLRADDRVAIVVYAGASGLVLPGTSGADRYALLGAIDRLQAGGSTNGGEGIQLAYDIAMGQFVPGGINRVILATDGDFNVGVTDEGSLVRLIEEKAKSGVFLTVLGFGMGNYKDAMLETLADKGNGNYAYIDGLSEARKVLVEQVSGTLVTIAKDVKIQVEFNPAAVAAYRLIGYENRILAAEDFNDDTKDAGEIGAGHTVTALYDVVPVGVPLDLPGVDPLKYQSTPQLSGAASSGELLTVKLRYKQPDGVFSRLLEVPVRDEGAGYESAPGDLLFAAAVAEFGMLLRNSPYRGQATFDQALGLAQPGLARDPGGYRAEFVTLVRQTQAIVGWRQ